MNALLLSCGTGGGHDSACAACAEALTERGHRVTTLNPYTLKSTLLAKGVDRAYISLARRAPAAFGAVYRLGDAYRRLPVRSPVYGLNRRMGPDLCRFLREGQFDVILCTHLFPAEILTGLKRKGFPLPPVVYIATDYTCIPFTEETDCDAYVVPWNASWEFIRRGIAPERVFALGIPVSSRFSEPVDRAALREELGLDAEKKLILLSGGSMGAGCMEKAVSLLAPRAGRDWQLVVVCGRNPGLAEKLRAAYGDACTVLGFTDRFADHLAASDLFITKPGGLSSTEAAVRGVPLIHLSPIPGCETANMRLFSAQGMSLAVTDPEAQLTEACRRLLAGPERERMLQAQRRGVPADSAAMICRLAEYKVRESVCAWQLSS